jgi:hypothetical protein
LQTQKSTSFFRKNCMVAEKLQKSEIKFFSESDIRDRVRGILQKSKQIIAKIVFFDPKSDFPFFPSHCAPILLLWLR